MNISRIKWVERYAGATKNQSILFRIGCMKAFAYYYLHSCMNIQKIGGTQWKAKKLSA